MAENFSNNYSSTLNASISDTDLSLVVVSATGSPSANFRMKIGSELLLVTAKAGTTFTVQRGIENTTAASHTAGDAVTHILTAEGLHQAVTGGWTEIWKTSDQSVVNSATMTSDSELVFALEATSLYHIEYFIFYVGNDATGDYKWRFTYPTLSAASNALGQNIGLSTADAVSFTGLLGSTTQWPSADTAQGGDAGATIRNFSGRLMLRSNTAGNFQFQFANNSAASGRTSTTKAGSLLRYRKVA